MGMEPTSLSRILKSMEDKGAIYREKNPADGRSVIIKLTEYGHEMRKFSSNHVIEFNNAIRDHVSQEDLDAFFRVMTTINTLIAEKKIFENVSQDK
jgi:DNA-binding MarR family transcriptional regulator